MPGTGSVPGIAMSVVPRNAGLFPSLWLTARSLWRNDSALTGRGPRAYVPPSNPGPGTGHHPLV